VLIRFVYRVYRMCKGSFQDPQIISPISEGLLKLPNAILQSHHAG
jgi:hypothetical protein